jgi:hypothetical protein
LRLSIFAAVLLGGVVTAQAADDAGCLASPTRACVLTMAVNAIEPVLAQKQPADTDRKLVIWRTAEAIIQSAADSGQFDLALGLVSSFEPNYSGIETGRLFVAMKLGGREKDAPPKMAQDTSADMYTGPALVANGRDEDFAAFVKARKLSGYDLAGMRMAGDLMAGHADKALAILAPFTGDDRTNAVTRTLEMLLLARRMDASKPMFAQLDLATPDGVATCARIAEGTKDRAIAERCADALDGLPPRRSRITSGPEPSSPKSWARWRQWGTGSSRWLSFARNRRTLRRPRSSSSSNTAIRPSCFRSLGKSLCQAHPRAAPIGRGC